MKKDLLIVVPGFELNSPKLEEIPNLHQVNIKDYGYSIKKNKKNPLKNKKRR